MPPWYVIALGVCAGVGLAVALCNLGVQPRRRRRWR